MVRLVAALVLFTGALLILNSGCLKTPPPKGKQPSALSGPAVIPASWPVPELTLPAGAAKELLPFSKRGQPPFDHQIAGNEILGPPIPGRFWIIAFDCPMQWPDMLKHVEGCIFPAGYVQTEDVPLRSLSRLISQARREYRSSDGTVVVKITWEQISANALQGAYDAFCYEVEVWEQAPDW